MPAAKIPSRKSATLEPKEVKLPARPSPVGKTVLPKTEHKRWPKPQGRYRPMTDIGVPTEMREAGDDPSDTKR
jgi:hypothetical protein